MVNRNILSTVLNENKSASRGMTDKVAADLGYTNTPDAVERAIDGAPKLTEAIKLASTPHDNSTERKHPWDLTQQEKDAGKIGLIAAREALKPKED